MANACSRLGDLALGVVRPSANQEQQFCGVGSCSAWKDLFLNSAVPVRYAKVGVGGVAAVATGITFTVAVAGTHTIGNGALVFFSNRVGDTAAAFAANTNLNYAPTLSETNYTTREYPVPLQGKYRWCTVGLAAIIEHPFTLVAGAMTYGDYLTTVAEFRETIREHLMNNGTLTAAKGNTQCAIQFGLLGQFIGSNQPSGGDIRTNGAMCSGALGYTPLNTVLVEESYDGLERMTISLALTRGFIVDPTSVAVVAEDVTVPVRLEKFGFLFEEPGAGDFYEKLPEGMKPDALQTKNAAGAWGG